MYLNYEAEIVAGERIYGGNVVIYKYAWTDAT